MSQIEPQFEAMYYWGLTFTNVMLDLMAVMIFSGYAKTWQELQKLRSSINVSS